MITPEQIKENENGIKILNNHKDWTSLEQVPRDKYFPDYILQCDSAACFFASWYQGKNDTIHFFDAGKKDVLINDFSKMDLMRKLYPKDWRYEEGDAFEIVKRIDRKYDVVTCDTSIRNLYREDFMDFYNITNKYLCLYANDVFLHDKGLSNNKDEITDILTDYHKQPIKVKELFKRPDSRGCLNYYWMIIEQRIGEQDV